MSLKYNWSPRFIQFCRSKGIQNLADFIIESNNMTEFTLWNKGKINEFLKVSPESFFHSHHSASRNPDRYELRDFAAYDKWLAGQYGEIN